MGKTFKGEKTRQLIIDKATILFTKNGYNHTSLSRILKATGLAKGGFYFHFRSKEELGIAVIKCLEDCWTDEILPKLQQGKDAKEKLEIMFSATGDCTSESGIRPTILLLTLATEMIEVNDKFSRMLQSIFKGWWMIIEAMIEEGKLQKIFRKEVDTTAVAAIILSNILGANLLSILNNKKDIYEKQLYMLKTVLFEGISIL
ncbi:MAG: TetR/AcrR family transcriptional regulator [bacterium]